MQEFLSETLAKKPTLQSHQPDMLFFANIILALNWFIFDIP